VGRVYAATRRARGTQRGKLMVRKKRTRRMTKTSNWEGIWRRSLPRASSERLFVLDPARLAQHAV
jgi:hypothetical protein